MAQTTTTADVPDADKLQDLVAEVDTGGRKLTGIVAGFVTALAILWSLAQLF